MAKAILIMGASGTGKSTSLASLPPEETLIITPNSKPLPWKGSAAQYQEKKNLIKVSDMTKVPMYLQKAAEGKQFKYVVVEDLTHYMSKRLMEDGFVASKDWGKWNRLAQSVTKMVVGELESYRDDLTVIFIAHTDTKENGVVGLKTAGKLLDNTIDIPSYFTHIFHSRVLKRDNNEISYVFQTNDDGVYMSKTPKGMFDSLYVPNDVKQLLDVLDQYYQS